ncbi:hypothetical protein V6N11_042732 [Hibiscus sabdariffa]|uniref:Uncharacterized protein n=1 Tax=Hibiscus sabdariffa TaxID=183260 RepID=A0ABR2QXN6_9ROSI
MLLKSFNYEKSIILTLTILTVVTLLLSLELVRWGFKVGKSGEEKASNGLYIQTKSGSKLPKKVALLEWVSSVSNQLDELVAQSDDKEGISVRSLDEDDPGDSRDMEVEIGLEERVDGKEVDIAAGDDMLF